MLFECKHLVECLLVDLSGINVTKDGLGAHGCLLSLGNLKKVLLVTCPSWDHLLADVSDLSLLEVLCALVLLRDVCNGLFPEGLIPVPSGDVLVQESCTFLIGFIHQL